MSEAPATGPSVTASPDACPRCHARPARYGGRRHGASATCWWCFIRSGPVVRRALATALIVGTVLTLINQPALYLHADVTIDRSLRVLLTYSVPYCVTTWGALGGAARSRSS